VMGFNIGRTLKKVVKAPVTFVKKDPLIRIVRADPIGPRVFNFARNTVTATVRDIRDRPLVGIGRAVLQANPYTGLALASYDVKRLRDKNKRAEKTFRKIKRQALQDAEGVKKNIQAFMSPKVFIGHTHTTPLNDGLTGMPCGSTADAQVACQYGFDVLQLGNASPGAPQTDNEKPAPEDRGTQDPAPMMSGVGWLVLVGVIGAAVYPMLRKG